MDIKKIKEILNSPISDELQSQLILRVIAHDKNAIPTVMEILKYEREQSRELIVDMNLELSRSHIFIDSFMPPEPKLKKGEKEHTFNKSFILDEIEKFYTKYKDMVTHCFNRFNDK